MKLFYCKKCVMPNTRPGITFDENGVCSACLNNERKQNVDWNKRYEELKLLCDKYRNSNGVGKHDCLIAVSGGKDSHFQVHIMKEEMKMHPLLVSVEDNFTMTEAGKHNIRNISEEFGCEIISLKPNIRAQKAIMRKTFEKYGKPTWYFDRLIYTYPLIMSLKFNIPLLVYGENISVEYGGADAKETYSANNQLKNGVASDIDFNELIDNEDVFLEDLSLCQAPSIEELEKIDSIYLSYFVKWNSYENYLFAKTKGFHDLEGEWNRSHHIENFDQVDSIGYLVHPWMKYPKFGHATATDYAARFVRYGMLTREKAFELVKEHDSKLDEKCVEDFCNFCGYTKEEFWNIVDKFYNRDLFEKISGKWVLKSDYK